MNVINNKRLQVSLFLAILLILIFVWYITFPIDTWMITPNYLQLYLEFIIGNPINAFLTLKMGPSGLLSWLFLPAYLAVILHYYLYNLGKKTGKQFTIINLPYIQYLILLTLFTISFQNASQYYGWYWNEELDVPGFVDTYTHIISPWLLGALFVPFRLERMFGWEKKRYWIFIFAIITIFAFVWEIGETLDTYINPSSVYFNYPLDSIKDLIFGIGIGTIVSTWLYERIVNVQ